MLPKFSKKILVYIPTYNCAQTILGVLEEIPAYFWDHADIMVLDNCSHDNTVDVVCKANESKQFKNQVHIVRPSVNQGYAGSQKLAYRIALASPSIEWAIMMHGDGQYPPCLLEKYIPYFDQQKNLVFYGYRSKRAYPKLEETPWIAYTVIKTLNVLENLLTGIKRLEWHTGFVMYHRKFLEKLNLPAMTTTMHMDGHMLFAAGVLGIHTQGISIYKRYREFDKFAGWGRVKYVFQVLYLMWSFKLAKNEILSESLEDNKLMNGEFECLM